MTPAPGRQAGGARRAQREPYEGANPEELRERYRAYRLRQAARLVHMLPREAVRPLYRKARAEVGGDLADPLAALTRYCERLLPLPPFDVWVADVRTSPDAHLADVARSAWAPTAAAPATVAVRRLEYAGADWRARLQAFSDGDVWRGFIRFEEAGGAAAHHTAVIFQEDDPAELRERFLAFDGATLFAFLRSSLP